MPESGIKKLWKNRISQQIAGFNFTTCISSSSSSSTTHEKDNAQAPPPSYAQTQSHNSNTNKRKSLWRKPLPSDCPSFDFVSSGDEKKTTSTVIVLPPKEEEEMVSILEEKTEIPTRYESRCYAEKIPNLKAHLDRASKNDKVILLSKLLGGEKQACRH